MQPLPLVASILVAALVTPTLVRALRDSGLVRENYRGASVAFPAGVAIAATAMLALVPLAMLHELTDIQAFPSLGDIEGTYFNRTSGEDFLFISGPLPAPAFEGILLYVIGVSALGLLDDVVGSADATDQEAAGPRGLRGHARAIAGGRFSTGAVKAAGSLGLALFVLSGYGLPAGEYLLAVAVLVLATNFFNLLDLRPGRSIKALVLLGAGLTLGTLDTDPLWALGIFIGPVLLLLPLDLRERAMLGDTGSNAVGAIAGLWLVLALSATGQAIALAVIALATLYGEFRSISALIERTPLLRSLDSLGRPTHA